MAGGGREERQVLEACPVPPQGACPGETRPVPAAMAARRVYAGRVGAGIPAQHVAPCAVPAGEQRLSLPRCGWSQPGPSRDAGCWLGAVPGLAALPPARSTFESPYPEPGSGAGEDGHITSSWSRLPAHVVCLVGHCKPGAPGRALPFSPLPESSAGATVEPDRPGTFGVARHLAQGVPRPAPGCCAVLEWTWVPDGAPLPTAA